jgi:hypothetical protein
MKSWKILGLSPTRDRSAVRRAYARKLKETNPEDDPEGFRQLREAYELALATCEPMEEASPPIGVLNDEEERDPQPAGIPSFRVEDLPENGPGLMLAGEAPPPGQQHRLDQLKLELLRALYERDEKRALSSWDEIRSLPAMVVIDTRWQFEEWIVWNLHDRDLLLPPSLVRSMDALFDWTERRKNHGAEDIEIVDLWLSSLRSSELIEALKEEASGWPRKLLRDKRALAARLLVGRFRPNLLLWAASHPGVAPAMVEIWREVATFDASAFRKLDPRAVDWWRRRVAAGFPWWIRAGQRLLRYTLAVSGVIAAAFGFVVAGILVTPSVDRARWFFDIAFYTATALLVVPSSYLFVAAPVVALLRVAEAAADWLRPRADWARYFSYPAVALGKVRAALAWCGIAENQDSSKPRNRLVEIVVMVLIAVALWAAFLFSLQ